MARPKILPSEYELDREIERIQKQINKLLKDIQILKQYEKKNN
jgi:hypothetical protein